MRIRIVSRGTGADTLILAVGDDGQEVRILGVRAVEWAIDHPRGRAEAKLTVRADVDVEGELTEWRPQSDGFEAAEALVRAERQRLDEDGMRLAPEGGLGWPGGLVLVIGTLAVAIGYLLDKA